MDRFSVLTWKKQEVVFVAIVLAATGGISFYQIKIGEMKTRDAQRKADAELVNRALRRYFDDYQVYPPEATGSGRILSCGFQGSEACEWGSGPLVDYYGVAYLAKLPRDPRGDEGYKYVYRVDRDRQHFRVSVALEYRRDAAYKQLTEECGGRVQCSWYVQE